MVARVTRSFGPASIMAKSVTPAASARNSVCPGNWKPARPAHSFEMGAVTSPQRAPLQHRLGRRAQIRHLGPPTGFAGLPRAYLVGSQTRDGPDPFLRRRRHARHPRRARQHTRIAEHQRRDRRPQRQRPHHHFGPDAGRITE